MLRPDCRAHPFLRLGDQDLEWREPGLAPRDRIQIHDDPGSGAIGHLRCGAGDPAGAQVLEPLDKASFDQLERRLDQQLFGERVPDLDARSLGRVVVGEGRARKHRGSPDAVTPGGRAEQDDEVARPGRRGEGQASLLEQTDGHDVDQWVALVARIEDQLAADRRNPDAVAVAADAANDAVDQVTRPWM